MHGSAAVWGRPQLAGDAPWKRLPKAPPSPLPTSNLILSNLQSGDISTHSFRKN